MKIFARIFLLFFYIAAFSGLSHAQGWAELGMGSHALNTSFGFRCMCLDSGGILYTGGFTDSLSDTSGYQYVAKWDGTNWSQLGTGTNTLFAIGGFASICVDAAHNVYAAGFIKDTVNKFKVAKWDGTAWAELGSGANALHANSEIFSICTDRAGNVYAAGDFTDSVSYTAGYKYVAKWDGTSWSELGTGSNALNAQEEILSIIADSDGNIYAAGDFWHLPDGYNYVAKWNGTSWSELGTGIHALNANGFIHTLCKDGDENIYAAGWFADSATNVYVAKWDGTSWNELGTTGVNASYGNPIFSVCTDIKGNVYAAGAFMDTAQKFYVAKWNGTVWQELGTGSSALNANNIINSVCVDTVGNIYAAGGFTDSTYPLGHCYVATYREVFEGILTVENAGDNVVVFPNPTANKIDIKVTHNIADDTYNLFDVTGKVIISGKLKNDITTVDLSMLASGYYILKIINYENEIFKVIKK